MYLVSQPEIAYVKSDTQPDILVRWFPPAGMFYKYSVVEFSDGTPNEKIKEKLIVSDTPVQLTREEIHYYKNRYST
jgi:hypothetical protein